LNLIFCGFIARLNGLLFQRVEKVINRNSLPMPRERPTVWKVRGSVQLSNLYSSYLML
jgi:hypothetical protein